MLFQLLSSLMAIGFHVNLDLEKTLDRLPAYGAFVGLTS
uniref:Uncharacterized protein n=1 Tax=Arundo donax TaxID=35708 RepID=A0A0A9ET88_ARUDO